MTFGEREITEQSACLQPAPAAAKHSATSGVSPRTQGTLTPGHSLPSDVARSAAARRTLAQSASEQHSPRKESPDIGAVAETAAAQIFKDESFDELDVAVEAYLENDTEVSSFSSPAPVRESEPPRRTRGAQPCRAGGTRL